MAFEQCHLPPAPCNKLCSRYGHAQEDGGSLFPQLLVYSYAFTPGEGHQCLYSLQPHVAKVLFQASLG